MTIDSINPSIALSPENLGQPALLSFPGLGFPNADGRWSIFFSGRAFRAPLNFGLRQRMMIRILGRFLMATSEELEGSLFQQRILPFAGKGQRRQRVMVEMGSSSIRLRGRTGKTGEFREFVTVDPHQLESAVETDVQGRRSIEYRLWIEGKPGQSTIGRAYLMDREGTSFISDIDDTIKDSFVVDRQQLLVNTFLKEFRSIEGMAEVYRELADLGASFHYVSSSPWQLYEPILQMKLKDGFPPGSIHLKTFRFRDHFFRRMRFNPKGKLTAIRFLLKQMPCRQFVLIGDSGESDPEIYANVCQHFPDQIKGLFIRNLDQRPLTDNRLERLQSSFRSGKFGLFQTASELRNLVAELPCN